MAETAPRAKTGGFVSGCLSLAITWVVLAMVTYAMTAPLRPAVLRVGMAVASALLLTLGLRSFWSLAWGEQGDSLETLIRRARKGEMPPDGEPIVADGVVRPLSSALTAPLSGVECVAYTYRMFYQEWRTVRRHRGGSSRVLVDVPVYWGHAYRPFAIDSPVAQLRVLAIPQMLYAAAPRQGPDAVEQARQWVQATRFEPVDPNGLTGLGAAFEQARDLISDDDGEARLDLKAEGDERDPETLRLEETLLPVGAAASAHGLWSAERGAIVSGGMLGTTPVSVTVGVGRDKKLKRAIGVGHSIGAYLVSATLLTVLGAGLVWFSRSILPSMVYPGLR